MKKKSIFKLVLLLIMLIPVGVLAGGSNDDNIAYNVKCEYNLVASHPADYDVSLTTIWVYIDENNSKYKMTYLNKDSKEAELSGLKNDYLNYDKVNTKQSLSNQDGDFSVFDYNYKNNNKACPDMYVYTNNITYFPLSIFNHEYAKNPYKKISPNKKYTSTDGGKNWSSTGGNTSSDDITVVRECEYNFMTDFGKSTKDPFKFKVKFEKQKNNTKNTFVYNVYVSGNEQSITFNNALSQTLFNLGNITGVGDSHQLYITEATKKAILDGTDCLASNALYSYNNGDRAGVKEFVITSDKKEAENNTQGDIYDGDSGNTSQNEEDNNYNPGTEVTGCDVVPEEVRKWISISLNFVKYVALVLVVVLGTIDFIKAAGSGEPDAMKKAGQTFIKRVIAVIILFLLPMIVELILHLINLYGATDDCFNVLG
mgnify:CR=1 FL=1